MIPQSQLFKKILLISFYCCGFFYINGQSILPNDLNSYVLESNLGSNSFLIHKEFVEVIDSVDRNTHFVMYTKEITGESIQIKRTLNSDGEMNIIIDYLLASPVAYSRFVNFLQHSYFKFDKARDCYRYQLSSYEYLSMRLDAKQIIQDKVVYQIHCTKHIGKELSMPPAQ